MIPARKPTQQVVAYFGRDVQYNSAGIGAPWEVGTIPAGGILDRLVILVPVGFDFGGAYQVSVGIDGDPSYFYIQGIGSSDPLRLDIALNADKCGPWTMDLGVTLTIEAAPSRLAPGERIMPTAGHGFLWLTYIPHPLIAGQPAIDPGA